MTVGVLALQGGFDAHARALVEVGCTVRLVREAEQLADLDGLVLPGGESSTQLKLLRRFGIDGPLDAFVRSGKPVLCTCAGLILAAQQVTDPGQTSFGWLDVDVSRNGWGRQVHSFEAESDMGRPLLFIRAPRITRLGEVEVVETFHGEPVTVRCGNVTGSADHPELTPDRSLHRALFNGT